MCMTAYEHAGRQVEPFLQRLAEPLKETLQAGFMEIDNGTLAANGNGNGSSGFVPLNKAFSARSMAAADTDADEGTRTDDGTTTGTGTGSAGT